MNEFGNPRPLLLFFLLLLFSLPKKSKRELN
jgi:hypothetical protein